jgi:hypothetical protein
MKLKCTKKISFDFVRLAKKSQLQISFKRFSPLVLEKSIYLFILKKYFNSFSKKKSNLTVYDIFTL